MTTPREEAEEALAEATLEGFRAYWEMSREARDAIDCDEKEFMIRYAIKKLAPSGKRPEWLQP